MLKLATIREFVTLQRRLLALIETTHQDALKSPYLLLLPKTGSIGDGVSTWLFAKHGTGVRFVRGGDSLTVDVSSAVSSPDAFDAWRIAEFLRSRTIEAPLEREVEARLIEFVEEGNVVRDTNKSMLYRLR